MDSRSRNVIRIDPRAPQPAAVARAAAVLRAGGLVAFPTETVYGLGAHALDAMAVRKIFAAKQRPDWDPLIVHVSGLPMARTLMNEPPPAFTALTDAFWPGPLTVVVAKAAAVPDEVTAGRPTVAVRQPRHPVAAALLDAAALPIAAPSANRFGRPSATTPAHVLADLGDRVDLILDAGPTPLGVESTIVDLTAVPPAILRPGGISREALEAVLGPVTLAAGVAEQVAWQGLAAPGMTTRHYAPRARLELFGGEPEQIADQIRARAGALQQNHRRVGVILHAEAGGVPTADVCLVYGPWGDWEQLAARLFAFLRALDDHGVEVILAALPPAVGLGLAVRDRLQRAAAVQ